ncbi:MAG: TIGR02281 family clan AA aspartic protease [Kangiellaceae bacterium]|jgi:aspartyl protease family protein
MKTELKYFVLLFFSTVVLFQTTKVAAQSAEPIEFEVIALFKDAAMIQHSSKQKLLRVGQSYKKRIKLIAATSHGATFLVDGEKVELGLHQSKLGNSIESEQPSTIKSISIPRNTMGMYKTSGFINGFPVTFLVDTGASSVAMNESTAQRIGLQYKMKGRKIIVSTASGRARAWNLMADKVSVGAIQLSHVEATVVQGTGPTEVLLGMSFLKRLKMQDDGNLMKLSTKF